MKPLVMHYKESALSASTSENNSPQTRTAVS